MSPLAAGTPWLDRELSPERGSSVSEDHSEEHFLFLLSWRVETCPGEARSGLARPDLIHSAEPGLLLFHLPFDLAWALLFTSEPSPLINDVPLSEGWGSP